MKYASTAMVGGQEAIAALLPLEMVPHLDRGNMPPGTYIVGDEAQKGWVKTWTEPPVAGDKGGGPASPGAFAWAPPEPSMEQLMAECTAAVQARLDAFAKTRGYDSIHTAVGYRGDEDPQFALEGEYCCQMRSRTWRACHEVTGAVLAGERGAPTLGELLAELPELVWPAGGTQ